MLSCADEIVGMNVSWSGEKASLAGVDGTRDVRDFSGVLRYCLLFFFFCGGGALWSLWAADGLWVGAWATRRVVHPAIHR